MKVKIALTILMAFIITMFFENRAFAIAAWARRYKQDCASCHAQVNKFNKAGKQFLMLGHRLYGDSWEKKAAGGEAAEFGVKEEPEALSLSDYLSITQKTRAIGTITDFEDKNKEQEKASTFDVEAFPIYTGGPLGKHFSYFTEIYIHESASGKVFASDLAGDFRDYGRSKMADSFIQFNVGDEKSYTAIRAGQFQAWFIQLHGAGARLTITRPYVIEASQVGQNPYRPRQRNYGVEINQYMRGLIGSLGVVNGTGHVPFNVRDNNNFKDIYATAVYTLDKTDSKFDGSDIGVYGYLGRYPITEKKDGKIDPLYDDDFYRVGAGGSLVYSGLEISGVALTGKNTVSPKESESKQTNLGFFVEADYIINKWLAPFVRYDYLDPNTDKEFDKVQGLVFGVSYHMLRWGRAVLENGIQKSEARDSKTGNKDLKASKTTYSSVLEVQYMY